MMSPRAQPLALLLVLALAASGCLGEPAAPDAPADDAVARAPDAVAWGLDSCRYFIAFTAVDEERLRRYLPEGFEPMAGGVAPMVPLSRPQLSVEAFQCAAASADGALLQDVPYGSFYTGASPPEELAVPGTEMSFVKWDTLVASPDLRQRLVDAGLPARDGSVVVPMADPAVGAALSAQLTLEGVGTIDMAGVVTQAGPTGSEPFLFTEYTPLAQGGVARWRAIATAGDAFAAGRGTLRLPAGSWAADVVGAEVAEARFIVGTWTFTEGLLELDATRAPAAAQPVTAAAADAAPPANARTEVRFVAEGESETFACHPAGCFATDARMADVPHEPRPHRLVGTATWTSGVDRSAPMEAYLLVENEDGGWDWGPEVLPPATGTPPLAIDWDLTPFEGKRLALAMVSGMRTPATWHGVAQGWTFEGTLKTDAAG